MSNHHKINYVEIPSKDLESTKSFFVKAFGWSFTDYGPDYTAITDGGLDGGFFRAETVAQTSNGSALVVLYSEELERTEQDVQDSGASIVKPIFSFPGGRRFHFTEPSGSEFAVWSDKEP